MDHIGAASGPLLALLYVRYWPEDFRPLFLLTLIPGVVVVAILVFGLREPRKHGVAAAPFVWSLKPFSGNYRVYLLSIFLFSLGNSSDSLLLLRGSEIGMSQSSLIWLWFMFSMTKSAGNLAVGKLVERLGARRLILGGWLAYALVYLGFGLASEAWHIWALFFAYAVFYSLTEPPEKTLVAQLVPGDRKGLAYGWYNFAIGIAALPASAICGELYRDFGPLQAFGLGGAFAMLAAGVLLFGVRNPAPETSEGAV
jgi:predicted MFS family arabinose efflux permease